MENDIINYCVVIFFFPSIPSLLSSLAFRAALQFLLLQAESPSYIMFIGQLTYPKYQSQNHSLCVEIFS